MSNLYFRNIKFFIHLHNLYYHIKIVRQNKKKPVFHFVEILFYHSVIIENPAYNDIMYILYIHVCVFVIGMRNFSFGN